MRVAFVVPGLELYGGVGIVVGHARRLRRHHGFDARLVLARTDGAAGRYDHDGLGGVPVLTLEQAAGERFDVAVATWWETTLVLHHLAAERSAYFVQSMEDRFYPPDAPERSVSALTHDLPLSLITEARWIAEQLAEIRGPHERCPVHYVRNGIDKAVFRIPDRLEPQLDGPLRIVVEGSPHVPLKGVPEALAATAQMRERAHVTLVCADPAAADGAAVDAVVGPLTAEGMAELLGRTDVVLKTSRVEGMAAPPLEGFHRGATCVTTPVTGHDEYIAHGRNALVTSWDDPRGTARLLDLLARDRRLLHELRVGAVRTARSWPSCEQSTAMMALALRRIAAAPSPDPSGAAAATVNELRMAMQTQQARQRDHERLQARMQRVEGLLSRGPLKVARRALAGRR